MARFAQITGWGRAVPSRVMTNFDVAKIVDTSDDWIRARTGIVERRVAGPRDTVASLSVKAAQEALSVADLNPTKLDLIVVATCTPDQPMPSAASLIQSSLGAPYAGAFDVNAACSGFVYALSVGSAMITSGAHRNVLVIGADTLTRNLDWTDRSTCVLFGDGAGAVLLQESDTETGIRSCVLGSDGTGAAALFIPAGGSRMPATLETVQTRQHAIKMKGNEVYRFAVRIIVESLQKALRQADLTIDDIDLFIPHQANIRIIESAAKQLKLPPEKVFANVDRYGNTSAASIPIALCEAVEQGRIQPGANVAMVGFGAGLSWGAAVAQWGIRTGPVPTNWWRSVVHTIQGRELAARSFALRTSRRLDALWRSNGANGA